uniref:Protein kinase domain-containing protein n=1 Tax=viral metagenome TaxID=1070528 RepID=A0A6C0ELJ6_9ZZZZ
MILFYLQLLITLIVNILIIPFFLLYKCYLVPEWIHNKFIKYIIIFNGPVFIKYVQLLLIDKEALREHISNDLINELTNLEDKIYKPIKLNNKITINNENLNIENSYSISSGTISSVYEFSYNNKDYILKKVHKNVVQNIKRGYILLKIILTKFPFISKYKKFCKLVDIKNFENVLLKQCDMHYESGALQQFYRLFKTSLIINTPKYVFNTQNILIMQKLDGYKLDDFIKLYPNKKLETYCLLTSTVYTMIKYKFLHGDFHFGNMFFDIKNDTVVINIFDFGIVFNLSDEQSKNLLDYIETQQTDKLVCFLKTINPNIPTDYKQLYSRRIDSIDIDLIKNYHIPLEIINLLSIFQNISLFFTKNNLNDLIDYMIANDIMD